MSLVKFVPAAELLEFPEPDALIEGFLMEQEAASLYGEPNGGKSFVALDWALCVATGKPWLDIYPVKQGPVVYMAGEGAASMQKRIKAWMQHHKVAHLDGVYFQTRPLPLRDEDTIDEIQKTLKKVFIKDRGPCDVRPNLIVVDTLSQFMMGGDEVAGPDMALFVSNCRRLSQEAETAILIVHHTNAGGMRERGHSSLRGNVDTMFKCTPTYQDNVLVGIDVLNDKQRDQARTTTLHLKLPLVITGQNSKGEDVGSLVVVPTMAPRSTLPVVKAEDLRVLRVMVCAEDEKTEKVSNSTIVEATGMLRGTVHKRLERLAQMGLVKHREGKSALTTLGRAVLDKNKEEEE